MALCSVLSSSVPMLALQKVFVMKRSMDESDLSDGQRRKSARSLDFGLQRSAECEGSDADERDCATTRSSINYVLRRQLLQKKTSNSAEVTAKAARLERLVRWQRDLKSAGVCGGLTSLTSKHPPIEDVDHTTIPDRVLVLYPSDTHTYDVKTGPFSLCVWSFTSMVPGVCNVPFSNTH